MLEWLNRAEKLAKQLYKKRWDNLSKSEQQYIARNWYRLYTVDENKVEELYKGKKIELGGY